MALFKIRSDNICIIGTLVLLALIGIGTVRCYEKTLRKIVRNQSKMVQRPFGDMSGILSSRDDSGINPFNSHIQVARGAPVRTLFYRTMRPLVSLVASQKGISRAQTYPRFVSQLEKPQPFEIRSTRNIFLNSTKTNQDQYDLFFFEQDINKGSAWKNIQSIHRIPFSIFPPIDEEELQTIELKPLLKENTTLPTPETLHETNAVGFLSKEMSSAKGAKDAILSIRLENGEKRQLVQPVHDSLKTDYSMEVTAHGDYNMSVEGSQTCAVIKTARTNIETRKLFSEFNIEPPWMTNKHFWNSIFNSRYEYLMRNPKWPPLKVILVPRTHVDTIWKNTFEHYSNNSASKILSNIVKKMNFYTNLTFTWNEVSHLSQWWKTTTQKSRAVFRKLLKERRLEITTGSWVECDEATTHIFGLVHNLIQGHRWLAEHLSYSPQVAWLTNTATHSPTMAYLLSLSGITKLIFTNVHFSWEEYFAEYQISDFVWVQDWINEGFQSSELNKLLKRIGKDRYPSNSVISHYLQFNADGFEACGPNRQLCATEFNFLGPTKLLGIHEYNIKEKSELLLEQYSKTGTLTPHNIVIAPIGGPHHFETQPEFDYQYNNYHKIADFTNVNRDIYKATMEFGTPLDYFNSIFQRNLSYPSLRGDFMNFADVKSGSPAYWTSFFTSRPQLKILLRRLQSTLRSTEILFSFALMRLSNGLRDINDTDIIEVLAKSRETVARLLDRNVVSGTLSSNALQYVHDKIKRTLNDCWHLQEVLISLLTNGTRNEPYLRKYVYRQGEFISVFRTVGPGDDVLVFNSFSHERFEVMELFTKSPNIRIVDHSKKTVTIQVNPVWKYNSKNILVISNRFFKIIVAVLIPPLTIELFKIKEAQSNTNSIATVYCEKCIVEEYTNSRFFFPFNIQPIEKGDIRLESYKHQLVFDETTGFLKTVVEKDTNTEKTVVIDYKAFASSFVNSGVFIFNINMTMPVRDILKPYRTGWKSKIFIIVTGQLTTEFTSVYGRLLQHTVKIFNLLNTPLSSAIYIESKVDLDVSPKNRDVEIFMSIQTDISNGNPPEIYTDNNGFQFAPRTVNTSKRFESNVYPLTTQGYIQDHMHRLTVITDHAQGMTALQEGQLVVMLDRRVLIDDGRGTEEGPTDSGASCQRHYILLENFIKTHGKYDPEISHSKAVQLPSFQANYLSNTFNYDLELFIIEKNNETDHYLYAYVPLVKDPFPCDITLLNYRAILDGISVKPWSATMTLMILHRQSFTCQINYEALVNCDVDPKFSIEKIFQNTKSVFKTNLAGTNKGMRINNINKNNFSPMELLTLRIQF